MDEAEQLYEELKITIRLAAAKGEYEPALRAYMWLLEHLPAEDGQRMLDVSVDKNQVTDGGPKGPMIQIGIIQSGVPVPKELPAITIEATPVLPDDTE
jgi:hypothetical protein